MLAPLGALFLSAAIAQSDTAQRDVFPAGRPISSFIIGQNDWYNPPAAVWPIVQRSGVKLVRIGGNGPDKVFDASLVPPTAFQNLLKRVALIRGIGAEPLIQVPRKKAAEGSTLAAQAAAMVKYINVDHAQDAGGKVKYWSIGNEPDLHSKLSNAALAEYTAGYIKEISTAMRDVDPSIFILAPDYASYEDQRFADLLGGKSDITGKDSKDRYYIDGIAFHRYPFGNPNTYTRSQVLAEMHTGFERVVSQLQNQIESANQHSQRTGEHALTWSLTEYNITFKNPDEARKDGLGTTSFINGQFFAEYCRVGMKRGAQIMTTWSIAEGGGAGGPGDLGYLGGNPGQTPSLRSSYYHLQMIANYLLPGEYIECSSSEPTLALISTTTDHRRQLAVMLLNEDSVARDFSLRMDNTDGMKGDAVLLKVAAALPQVYKSSIPGDTTVVLIFDTLGHLKRRISYGLREHYAHDLPPQVQDF